MTRHRLALALLLLGYAFLYLPIALMIGYSFNASRLVTVWAGFSTRWYGELLRNERMIEAAWLTLRIAAAAATLGCLVGTLGGFALARFGRFRGRLLLVGMLSAPLVLPDVISGLSLLMLFVGLEQALGWPERGALTIVIAHATLGAAYVAVIVQARLAGFDHRLEEAALDLGARPTTVFLRITLPLIAPSLVAGWLLAFTLSMDDLVIASFVSGPGSTTLPMLVFASVRLGVSPQINALATILVAVVAAGMLGAALMLRARGR